MTLREELARKLQRQFHYCGVCAAAEPSEYWFRLADECIRQMEWARRMTVTMELGTALAAKDRGCEQICDYRPLTVAPETWKP